MTSLPTFSLHRNQNLKKENYNFRPGDLITLKFSNTGDWKLTQCIMNDNRELQRFFGKSGGKDHTWETRIQNTKSFGKWNFTVSGPLPGSDETFSVSIPFNILKVIPRYLIPLPKPPLEFPVMIVPEIIEIPVEAPIVVKEVKSKTEIPVVEIKGVGPAFEKRLNNEHVFFIHQLISKTESEIVLITNSPPTKVQGWFEEIPNILADADHPLMIKYAPKGKFKASINKSDLPSVISGIGGTTEIKLTKLGYQNVGKIVDSDPEKLAKAMNRPLTKIIQWIEDAQIKLYGKVEKKTIKALEKDETIKSKHKKSEPVSVVPGIGPKTYEKLDAAGYGKLNSLVDADPQEVAKLTHISVKKVSNWIILAQKMLKVKKVEKKATKILTAEKPKVEVEELRSIKGIGPTYLKRLTEANITTIKNLISIQPTVLAKTAKVPLKKAKTWIALGEEFLSHKHSH